MVDWAGHYSAIYNALGVDAVITIAETNAQEDLRVIDKTAGVQIAEGGDLSVTTIVPACAVRVTELTAKGIDLGKLRGSRLTMNGAAWRVESRQMKPSPAGEMAGEVYLILIEDRDA